MQFSKKWLNEFVDKDLNEIKLSEILTQGGLEVEEVEDLSLISDLVVVGEIVGLQKHPNADRLNVCQVNVGQKDDLQIVCGAPNARVGIKVPCAKVGTKLDKFEIKKAKLRVSWDRRPHCSPRRRQRRQHQRFCFRFPPRPSAASRISPSPTP